MEEEIRKYEYEFSSIEDIKKYIDKYDPKEQKSPGNKEFYTSKSREKKYDFYKCRFLSNVESEWIEFLRKVPEKESIWFRGCRFEMDIEFNNHEFKNSINFYKCEFQEIGDFRGAVFTEQADFNNCKFLKKGDFWNCKFEKEADFSNCKFQENANFKECEFKGKAGFNKAIFTKQANFNDITFTEQANFNDTTFTEQANFNWATFTEQAIFWGTTFTEKADFNNCKFLKKAYFEKVTFTKEADFRGTTFTEKADFNGSTFTEKANFKECEFKGKADFINTTFKEVFFEQTIFRKKIDLSYESPEREIQELEKVKRSNSKINEVEENRIQELKERIQKIENSKNINTLEFIESTFEDNIYLYSRKIENFTLFNNRFEKAFSFSDSEIKNTDRETARVLKDVLIKQNNRIEALQYHKKEMEAHRIELMNGLEGNGKGSTSSALADISVLLLNKYSNNHGHSWFGGVLFFLITTNLVFFLYLYSLDIEINLEIYKYYFEFIIPTHKFDFIPITKNLGWGADALDILGRIVSSFGIYQTIQAFRKFGKI